MVQVLVLLFIEQSTPGSDHWKTWMSAATTITSCTSTKLADASGMRNVCRERKWHKALRPGPYQQIMELVADGPFRAARSPAEGVSDHG